jgi:hypothetical protein
LTPTHPTWFDEKSGGAAFCCARAGAAVAAPINPVRTLPATNLALNANEDIYAPPLGVSVIVADYATAFVYFP